MTNVAIKYLSERLYLKKFLLSIPLFLLLSCSQYEKSVLEHPEKLISKDDFLEIMIDVRLIEITIRQKISQGQEADQVTQYYYEYLFEKHGIDAKQFDENLEYYASQPAEMAEINEHIVEHLIRLESEVKAQKSIE